MYVKLFFTSSQYTIRFNVKNSVTTIQKTELENIKLRIYRLLFIHGRGCKIDDGFTSKKTYASLDTWILIEKKRRLKVRVQSRRLIECKFAMHTSLNGHKKRGKDEKKVRKPHVHVGNLESIGLDSRMVDLLWNIKIPVKDFKCHFFLPSDERKFIQTQSQMPGEKCGCGLKIGSN